MNIGMLWYSRNPKISFDAKIEEAVVYYRSKYGQEPNLCFVHPSMIRGENGESDEPAKSGTVEVRVSRSILPNHFWIGVDGKKKESIQE